jgi:NADPH:quinone reductase-like Zn-dependent oxidoreductase
VYVETLGECGVKQIWIAAYGGPENLELREAPDPIPRDGEVRIRVRAAGVNFADILARKGLMACCTSPPQTILS